ncbi:ribosomal L7/L12 domain-containing protein [Rhizobium phage RHph_X2_25]|nr:ribosomal L7/L12 domain-containing protein [Rhizobium phage RHph_X2_25]
MGKFKIGDRVVEDKTQGCCDDLVEHWNRYWRRAEGELTNGEFVVTKIAGKFIHYSNREGGSGPQIEERYLKLAPWQPKVGDKVVWLEPFKAGMYTKGKEYLIHKRGGHGELCITDDNDNPDHSWRDESILRSFSLAVPLTIEAGKYYRTRDGRKVGPMETYDLPDEDLLSAKLDGNSKLFNRDGSHHYKNHDYDLIAEWVDEHPTASNDNAVKPKFKVGDKIKNPKGWIRFYTVTKVEGGKVWIDADGYKMGYDIDGVDWLVEVAATSATTQPTAIVALIENGQPKPANVPFVHATEQAASKEAARLASLHKGKQFGVYVLTSTSQEAAPTYKHEWQRLAVDGQKIAAIKELRALTGMQLKPAKDVVEHFIDYPYGAIAA